ncbi:hypothetical protein BJY04DRAFT_213623 [Aspergillus karnatakaensis]|uniref:FAD-dependent oxidoreductase n=1 Tax=Aspergillus karnatakaensis TaxID=1810916 RepID=UPI003CCCB08C
MASVPQPLPLRVIIIGGAITGLTLARCLEKAGIDYIILEKHTDVLTNLGGTIALLPAGCRVLDQLGVYDLLENCKSDLRGLVTALPDGHVYRKETFGMFGPKLGYPLTLLHRKDLLHALYTSLEDKSRIHVGAKVVDVAPQVETEVDGPLCVTIASGEVYTGDVVVGADGVHGATREHMWRIADLQQTPEGRTNHARKETGAMTVDYYTILGVTPATDSSRRLTELIRPGDMYMRCDKGVMLTLIKNPEGSVNWFVAFKMDKPCVYPDIPMKFSQEEIRAKLEEYAEWQAWGNIADNSDIKFQELWRDNPRLSATHLQEGVFDTWSRGRITCIGDTVFKFTPNLAQGANLCIESAAALANTLHGIKASGHATTANIHEALEVYPRTLQSRIKRLGVISYHTTRVHLLESRFLFYVARYILPYVMEPWVQFGVFLREHGMAVTLDYLPRPERDRLAADKRARAWRYWKIVGQFGLGLILGIGAFCWFRLC